MQSRFLTSAARSLSLLFLILVGCALAQGHGPTHFSGLINDYSPSTVKGGPWEMHGQWTLDLSQDVTGNANFSADMTMSDYGKTAAGAVDPTQAGQNPHTHHIRLTNARIIWNIIGCPTYSTPVPTTGFQFTSTVSLLTGNGSNAPFETTPPSSTLQVCVLGGDEGQYTVTNSNVTLVFVGPATTHFGTQAIHGVVRKTSADTDVRDRDLGRNDR